MANHLLHFSGVFATAARSSLHTASQTGLRQASHSNIRQFAGPTLRCIGTSSIHSTLHSSCTNSTASLLNRFSNQGCLSHNSSKVFNTFFKQLRGGHTCAPPSSAWDASAAVSSLVSLSRAHLRQSHLRTYGEVFSRVNEAMRLAPYWSALSWESVQRLYKQTYAWLPSLPEFRHFHISVLSAVNITGAHLPRSLALLAIEYVRATTR